MSNTGKSFEDFIDTVKKLRKGCPWDREQTIESLKPYLVEEVYEAIQAIDDRNYKKLAEEVGDMLLHVVMLSVFAAEDDLFSIDDVIASISAKMVRRHPHVFLPAGRHGGKGSAKTKEQVWLKWEKIKKAERKARGRGTKAKGRRPKAQGRRPKAQGRRPKAQGMLESIPRSLPALYKAEKVQRRAARVGFDWDQVAGAWGKVHEELDEVHELLKAKGPRPKARGRRIKEEIGDLLFAIVNVARKLDIDAEDALQLANAKFARRFSTVEKALLKKKLTIEQMDALWERAKSSER